MTSFAETRNDYFGDDDSYRMLQSFLLAAPTAGPAIPGCKGLRKIRWSDLRRGKGKRGGIRVVYLYIPDLETILFVDVYGKGESDDLTSEDKRELANIADQIRETLRQRRKQP